MYFWNDKHANVNDKLRFRSNQMKRKLRVKKDFSGVNDITTKRFPTSKLCFCVLRK